MRKEEIYPWMEGFRWILTAVLGMLFLTAGAAYCATEADVYGGNQRPLCSVPNQRRGRAFEESGNAGYFGAFVE